MLDLFTVNPLIDLWLAEDIGHGDLTALSMIEPDARATFHMNARQDLALAGIEVAAECFRRYDPNVKVEVTATDGNGGTGTQTYTSTVDPALVVSPSTLPMLATVGNIYSQQFSATGGSGSNYSFTATGMASSGFTPRISSRRRAMVLA